MRTHSAAARSTLGARMAAAAAAAGSGTPREEEGPSGEAAAPQSQAPTGASGPRLSRLPLARVKALVKADPDVTLAGQEAIFILARAAELFVETIAKDAYCCAQQGKRKTLQRRDLDNAIEAVDEFAFLEACHQNVIPEFIGWPLKVFRSSNKCDPRFKTC
ncbi:DNA polymerase epsilon subunit 4 isoform X1 [Manis pentadactyla]|uniref:DNA polymerase epsilon subunit 4 isoform X1 n=1 Tax=Manis pentadactyla TaxID=143292 RepID=UPI00255D02F5|nr:DNA polymerase epsilon subunit 4 isoform X1 [Manis pentadactyla]